MMTRILGIATTRARAMRVCTLAIALASCKTATIDSTVGSPISNDDTFTTLDDMWVGARTAMAAKREPSTSPFNLPLSYQVPCTRGGQGSYQGTLTGTKSNGAGTATLSMTATLTACQFDDNVKITTISASGFTVTGTIAIANDTWDAMNVRMVATNVTVNGVVCPGGVDVTITGTTPFVQAISSGTSCGRTGAVPLP